MAGLRRTPELNGHPRGLGRPWAVVAILRTVPAIHTRKKPKRNNYILVIFDSCRYDSFLKARPKIIRKLGKVERRWSYASWTSPSHYNFLIGLMPHVSPKHVFASEYYKKDFVQFNERFGCDDFEFKKLVPKLYIPAFLKDSLGYRTHAMVSLPVLNPKTILNNGFDSYGHGIFDGVSIVAGHEWAETLTDPHMNAWYDSKGFTGETGDKCTWPVGNIGFGGDYYAVQSLWSNNDGACVLAGAPSKDQSPTSFDFGVVVRYSSSSPLMVQLTNNGDLDLPLDLINNTPWYLTGANASDFWLSANTCGKILHPGASCQAQVSFRPLDFGTRQATLAARVPLNMNVTGNVTTLSGDGISQWMLFDPNNIVYGGVFIRSTGQAGQAEAPIRMHNIGDIPRLIQRVRLGGPHPSDFSIFEDSCSDRDLGPLQSCMVNLRFQPTATGDRQAELEITDATGSTFGIPVMGPGLGPVAQLSTTDLFFGNAVYSSDGVATGGEIPVSGEVHREITFTNTGQSPLGVSGVEVTGDFALDSDGCTQPLQPNASCMIHVRLMPTHFQFQSGALMIYDNTSDSPHEVKLTALVVAPIPSLVPDEVQFGSVAVGSASSPQTVWLENLEGYAALHIQSIAATGDFTATSDCPSDLAIGNCAITVTLEPTAAGPRSGMLVVTDNAPGSPRQIPLIGTGCAKGDLDCDGDVDQNDLNILLSYRNQPAGACPACDLDGDGTITALDARKLALLCTRSRCATR